jgi:serine/threonine-protein kinase
VPVDPLIPTPDAEFAQHLQRAFPNYTVEREIGSGGMATVYLAHDRKHDRKLAIKVLHAELAAVMGVERFVQEIRVTAGLQHPHILGLIDSGVLGDDAGELRGRPFYVMPFVEGESLRQRLDREQQLPVADAVRIATEVASALDYAHRHGVIHRDIKPENILLHDGSAIVADFGIALAVTQAGGTRITQTGLSLGTPSYMSPEQATGERTITARSDIYSLGAVTYEMLAGEPPFTGPTVQAVVARVMTDEPRPLTAQRRSVPLHVSGAVSHALEKVPADRFASAHEFAEALNNPSGAMSFSAPAMVGRVGGRRDRALLYGLAALALVFLGAAIWGWSRPAPPQPVLRYTLVFDSPEAIAPGAPWWSRVALSPDGSRLAYIGGPRGELLIRQRNQLHPTVVPQSAGAQSPFFSPDGDSVGFLKERKIEIAAVGGGSPVTVSDTLTGVAGATWGPDGFIYVDGQDLVSLLRVQARAGAVPRWFTTVDTARGELDHAWPEVLPSGEGIVFTVISRKNAHAPGFRFAIAAADIPSGKHRVIIDNAMYPRYVRSGYLLYVTPNRTLMVVPFDQRSMKVTGTPIALANGMRIGQFGAADVAVSQSGTLLYGIGGGEGKQELVWVGRDGKAQPVDPNWTGTFFSPALSPDGKQLAVSVVLKQPDIWIKQLDRGPAMRLTLEGGAFNPGWTADGRSVTYSSTGTTTGTNVRAGNLWTKRADGSAQRSVQLRALEAAVVPRWSRDGKWLVFMSNRGTGWDILGIRPGIDTAPVPLVATTSVAVSPAISPDGRWLAYSSLEAGQWDVYVVPFPDTHATRWIVSSGGGVGPLWSRDGSELFYRDTTGGVVAVTVKTRPTFSAGAPHPLFSGDGFLADDIGPNYAVSADGRRFLMIRPYDPGTPDKFVVVENWLEELKGKSR